MKTKKIDKKNNYFLGVIAVIALMFSSILIIQAVNQSKVYEMLGSETSANNQSVLGQKIAALQNTIEANALLAHQDYEKALQIISGTQSENYYNRATVQTLLAYKNALESNISGLENAQTYINQAQQNNELAKKLTSNKKILHAIASNQKTITALSLVINVKTCYGVAQETITTIENTITTTKDIQETIDQEQKIINQNQKKLGKECTQKLENIAHTSKQQLENLENTLKKNNKKNISDFFNKRENPMICIQIPYDNSIPSIQKGKKGLETYKEQHQATIAAIQSEDQNTINNLCNQAKNDAQINQQLDNDIQEMLEKIEENKKETTGASQPTPSIEYKDFIQKNEKKALEEIKKTNEGWINTIMNIRGKGQYIPERYINTLFNQFYGNSGDFIDLHK